MNMGKEIASDNFEEIQGEKIIGTKYKSSSGKRRIIYSIFVLGIVVALSAHFYRNAEYLYVNDNYEKVMKCIGTSPYNMPFLKS